MGNLCDGIIQIESLIYLHLENFVQSFQASFAFEGHDADLWKLLEMKILPDTCSMKGTNTLLRLSRIIHSL